MGQQLFLKDTQPQFAKIYLCSFILARIFIGSIYNQFFTDTFSSFIDKIPKQLYDKGFVIFNSVLLHIIELKGIIEFWSFIIWNQISKQMCRS